MESEAPIRKGWIIAALALFIAATVALRPAQETPSGALVPDRELLWRLPPGAQRAAEGHTAIQAPVLREGGPALAGARQILLLGDEEHFGAGRPLEQTLAGQLAARTRDAGLPTRVLNGAVPGYSLLQTRAWLAQEGWALEPDLLILSPGLSDCAPGVTTDAALLRCLDAPTQRLRWAWGRPPSADSLPELAWGRAPALEALGCAASPSPHRVPPEAYAEALDALLLDAAKRELGVVILLSDSARSAGCPHGVLTQRVSTRRAVPVLDLAEVNRSAGSWGRGARGEDGQPSVDAVTAAAQAVADLLRQANWPEHTLAPEIAAPPYRMTAQSHVPPGE